MSRWVNMIYFTLSHKSTCVTLCHSVLSHCSFALTGASWGGLDIRHGCPLASSCWRYSGCSQLEKTLELEQAQDTLDWEHLQPRRSRRMLHISCKMVSRVFNGGPVEDTIVTPSEKPDSGFRSLFLLSAFVWVSSANCRGTFQTCLWLEWSSPLMTTIVSYRVQGWTGTKKISSGI